MELLPMLILVGIVIFVLAKVFKKKKPSGGSATIEYGGAKKTTGQGTNFSSPIPSGFQIYAGNPGVAGIQHRKAEAIKFANANNQELSLEREPGNQHDANAIKLVGISGAKKFFIGYVPKEVAEQIVSTGLYDTVKVRLKRIYLGEDDFLEIQYDIVGPKTEKKKFDGFIDKQPATAEQKEYLKFFGLPVPRGMTSGQAEEFIGNHKKTSSVEEQDEWLGYANIIEEFDDSDFRETYDLKKVPKTVLLEAIEKLAMCKLRLEV